MTLQELLDTCRNYTNGEAVFQEIVAKHDKQIRAEAIDECIRAIYENTLNPVWEYGEGVNDCVKALEQLKEQKNE